MTAYYNEIDPYAAAWLRNLISAGHIAPGDVDERSIADVRPDDIRGYTQCHFFAGIGVWSYALRNAGWPDDRPVWTGSCPCPPFSAAGKGSECPSCGGKSCLSHPLVTAGWICLDCGDEWRGDDRHLLPEFIRLKGQCRPPVVFGEQVASRDGRLWLHTLRAVMERASYAVGSADLCAAGVGAPHIRQRLWFVEERLEHPAGDGWLERRPEAGWRSIAGGCGVDGLEHDVIAGLEGQRNGHSAAPGQWQESVRSASETGEPGGMADAGCSGDERCGGPGEAPGAPGPAESEAWERQRRGAPNRTGGASGGLPDTAEFGRIGWRSNAAGAESRSVERSARFRAASAEPSAAGPTNGFWRDADWLFCRDGKWRPVRPGSFPLVVGAPARMGRLRAYGNAIVAQAAEAFIRAYLETKRCED